jgi:hypothetical protein
VISFFKLGSEHDHNPILQEVIKLSRVRVQPLTLQIVNSGEKSDYDFVKINLLFKLTLCQEDQLENRSRLHPGFRFEKMKAWASSAQSFLV